MQAVVLEKPYHFTLASLPEPPPPAAGEALVAVHRVGVCGTDYSGYQGKMPFYSYPRIPGHELGVEVLAVGEGDGNVKPGDRCAVEPYINCQRCFACRRGNSNCCEKLEVLGVHCDGGLRPRFVVPARKLHVSGRLSLEQLALVETLGIGCHAIERARPQPDETVLVIGAGPIGLSLVEFARLSGARTIVMDLNEARLDFVRRSMGVGDTILAKGDGSELRALAELTGDNLAQVVVDATGNARSMSSALEYVSFTGRLVFLGITTQEIRFPQPPMHRREMTFLASRNALPTDFTRIISLIEQGQIDTRPWITHHAPLGEMIAEFPRWLDPANRVIKAMVEVS